MEKGSSENRKGKEILEAGIDLNKWIQLWDDKPLWVLKNPESLWPGASIHWAMESKWEYTNWKKKLCTMRMRKFRWIKLSNVSHW